MKFRGYARELRHTDTQRQTRTLQYAAPYRARRKNSFRTYGKTRLWFTCIHSNRNRDNTHVQVTTNAIIVCLTNGNVVYYIALPGVRYLT